MLHRVEEQRNLLHTVNKRKVNWIGVICHRNCLLKHVIEGKVEGRIEVMGRRGRRRKQLVDGVKERILEIERGSTRRHSVENWFWKKLWGCCEEFLHCLICRSDCWRLRVIRRLLSPRRVGLSLFPVLFLRYEEKEQNSWYSRKVSCWEF